ncbi:MAG: DUF1456 family protein [Bacteroidetes bacterium]|nr:MAG: DUF1456 family protein [Bacteroidota bacterium]MBL1144171.1 DUF1456 family protein [Bacteroidota bacterium]NOG56967.1 DUF1456 family protein [Bacteroidota bacterium]
MPLNNNDIIKKLRVALSLKDEDIVEILKLVDYDISKSELGAFFRKEDHEKYMPLQDQILRNFLNGLIIHKRGPMDEKPTSVAQKRAEEKKKPKPVVNKDSVEDRPSKTFKYRRKD